MFKTKFCWWPVRLARHIKKTHTNSTGMEFIGWVWMQRANLTDSQHHGWVALLDSSPPLRRCRECRQILLADGTNK